MKFHIWDFHFLILIKIELK